MCIYGVFALHCHYDVDRGIRCIFPNLNDSRIHRS